MHIDAVHVQNFRLLRDAQICLEPDTTVVVGRNNSGKTSLTELFRRFLATSNPTFRLEDFPVALHDCFWNAYVAARAGKPDGEVRALLPAISMTLTISYAGDTGEFGPLGPFVINLSPLCTEAQVEVRYQLRPGAVKDWYADLAAAKEPEDKPMFFKLFRQKLLKRFETVVEAVDPEDATNRRSMDMVRLRELVLVSFVSAQRHLDDATQGDRNVLGKIVEALFRAANASAAEREEGQVVQKIQAEVIEFEQTMDKMANDLLVVVTKALGAFGYPGLGDQHLRTEIMLDVESVIRDYLRVCFATGSGVALPETYNGMGPRNLVFMLLRLMEFWGEFRSLERAPGIHLTFVEEPEVHFHPQMAQAFIKQLQGAVEKVTGKEPWPVQFVVTTHSSHVANAAPFQSIRYFLKRPDPAGGDAWATEIRDLRRGFRAREDKDTVAFLQQYLTQTRCDLFFADKAILIEGTCERLLLPSMMAKVDSLLDLSEDRGLRSQYISIIEVGGAYAHLFRSLLDFLELQSLIITDIDCVRPGEKRRYKACVASEATGTSNLCIQDWFNDKHIGIPALHAKSDDAKVNGRVRLAYQVPEHPGDPCGRTLEDAFVISNAAMFQLQTAGRSHREVEQDAMDIAAASSKTAFALYHLMSPSQWTVPRYLREGLEWLCKTLPPAAFEVTNFPLHDVVGVSPSSAEINHAEAK